MTPTAQLIAREYRRLSNKKRGTSLSRQGSDNAVSASDNAWRLHPEPYIDDGLSASRYARKNRDDFEKLIADLQTGPTGRDSRFGADVLMLWESSRGSRKVGEWVEFIELCEAKHVLFWVTTHERLYDPRNGRDRKSLLEDAVDSEYESYKTHRRTSGTVAFQASIGRPHGAPPDGLMPVYDEKTGDLVTWVEDPDRAHIPRELFRLLEEGVSLTEIERRFRAAGYLNRSGSPYSREHLRQSALKHAYAGLRSYDGHVFEGTWDGIVDPARFWAVQRILNAPHRKTTRGGRASHELTGSLWCSRCLIPITKIRDEVAYQCTGCWLRIQKGPVDDYIIGTKEEPGALLAFLARRDLYKRLAARDGDDQELRELRARLEQARAERDEFRSAKGSNLAEAMVLANSLSAKEQEVTELEAHERDLSLPPSVAKMIRPDTDVWESWEEATVSARREVARVVLSERGLGKPYVLPAPSRGRNQLVVERLDFRN
ncbi:recombinase family protein [Streptomyces gilvus]|uniref:recombinase family protein n=1 Tax=Streptomyces gilvus TaxID=2920937 RepID=UPI001F117D00|nr:recombinase family protein [Streptomyces sp. CME 23]MCH5677986.1 recombinase family protein [Streptomyces sp. CME 23]